MTWLVQIKAVYDSAADAADVLEVLARNGITARQKDEVLTAAYDYGDWSRYGAARAASEALREVFDPVADDGPRNLGWPNTLTVRAYWQPPK